MQLHHRAGDRWVDLTATIVHETRRSHVMWVSCPGTFNMYATHDGRLIHVRHSVRTVHSGDGWPLLVQWPYFATACGAGDASGYRSTTPLLVATVDGVDDVEAVWHERVHWIWELGVGTRP